MELSIDMEKVIKGLVCCAKTEFPYGEIECDSIGECPYTEFTFEGKECCCISQLIKDALALLKEQEEQKQKWLKQIADAQIAVCPTGNETEEGLAKRTGEWNGLQMAFDILTNGR